MFYQAKHLLRTRSDLWWGVVLLTIIGLVAVGFTLFIVFTVSSEGPREPSSGPTITIPSPTSPSSNHLASLHPTHSRSHSRSSRVSPTSTGRASRATHHVITHPHAAASPEPSPAGSRPTHSTPPSSQSSVPPILRITPPLLPPIKIPITLGLPTLHL